MRGRRRVRRRHVWTPKQQDQLRFCSEALDVLTEFGVESASRERLLVVIGQAAGVVRMLRSRI